MRNRIIRTKVKVTNKDNIIRKMMELYGVKYQTAYNMLKLNEKPDEKKMIGNIDKQFKQFKLNKQ